MKFPRLSAQRKHWAAAVGGALMLACAVQTQRVKDPHVQPTPQRVDGTPKHLVYHDGRYHFELPSGWDMEAIHLDFVYGHSPGSESAAIELEYSAQTWTRDEPGSHVERLIRSDFGEWREARPSGGTGKYREASPDASVYVVEINDKDFV